MSDYLTRHGSGHRYFRAVPKALRSIVGRCAWHECLGQLPLPEARAKALMLAARDQKIIDGLMRLSDSERVTIVQAGGLEKWEAERELDEKIIGAATAVADMVPDPEMPDAMQAQTALEAHRARERVARLQAEAAGAQKIVRRLSSKGGSLLSLVELHAKVRPPRSSKTTEKARMIVGRLIDVVGDLAPNAVRRDDVIKFRDHLEANGFTQHNVTQHLSYLHALFNTALSEGAVASNPAHMVKARKSNGKLATGKQGKDFAGEQVKHIFKALDGETSDFQWIVRLLAFHGARSTEICQLKCADVTTLHGVPVLRIHDKHGSVKNQQSVRDIPIHPKCRGIVAYAADVAKRHGADAWLFMSLLDSKQGRGNPLQKYANKQFLHDKVGITAKVDGSRHYDQSLHSLRHTFSTLCREVGMPDSVKYALLGHTLGSGEGGRYGTAPSLKMRAPLRTSY